MRRDSPLLVAISALGLGLFGLWIGLAWFGYDAGKALTALWSGAFGSGYALSSATMVRAIPLTVIGLGLAVSFRAGALNIGAEGQFLAGAMAATWVGVSVGSLANWMSIPLVIGAGALAGGLWVLVPVILRLRFGVLEVISTLLLNFVADALVSYAVQGPLQESSRHYPQSDPVALTARLPLLPGTRLHLGFLLAMVIGLVLWLAFRRTAWGFRLRAVGESPAAASVAGRISVSRTLAGAMLLSGVLAGVAGAFEVAGVTYALYQNLSPGYGFTAIAVALIARNNPLGVLIAGILFGALEAGAGGMQREAGVPAVAVFVVQAAIIVVAALALTRSRMQRAEAET